MMLYVIVQSFVELQFKKQAQRIFKNHTWNQNRQGKYYLLNDGLQLKSCGFVKNFLYAFLVKCAVYRLTNNHSVEQECVDLINHRVLNLQ